MVRDMVRLSASIPKDIAEQAHEIALARKVSRSKLILECLKVMIEERNQQLLLEGYQAMAEEHKRFAILSEKATKEALPEWK